MTNPNLDPAQFGAAFKAFMDAMLAEAKPQDNPLLDRIRAHMGDDVAQLPVLTEEYDTFEQPNLQRAVDAYSVAPGHRVALAGVGAHIKRFGNFGLSHIVGLGDHFDGVPLEEGPVDYANMHLDRGEILPCIDTGLLFIHDGDVPLLVLILGPAEHGMREGLTVEVMAREREQARGFLSEIADLMDTLDVYRGHTIALAAGNFGPGRRTLISFRALPPITREDLILPEGVLDRIERETIVFAAHSDRLLAAGQSLKRGLLLYGPPGVGKTLTIEYLSNRMEGRTVILMTGMGMGLLEPAVKMARKLAPAMVVMEDVDLIAEERGSPFNRSGPLLFSLLNEMDGLQNDSDVIFILTTNRPDALEPALAARPGRIDLVAEFPLPDKSARLRLLELYARGLELRDVDLPAVADRINGATPAYIKELLRKAAVLAAMDGEHLVVTQRHLEAALGELDAGGQLAHRLLGLRALGEDENDGSPERRHHHAFPSGFPAEPGIFVPFDDR